MNEITIKLLPSQLKILKSDKANIVAILPRGCGKSYTIPFIFILKAYNCEGIGFLGAPIYSQAELALNYIIKFLDNNKIEYCYNKNPSFLKSNLSNHNRILSINLNGKLKQLRIGSFDVEESIRGANYSYGIIDEAAYISEEGYYTYLPCLRGLGNNFNYQTYFLTTPQGKNWIYSNFIDKERNDVEIIKTKAKENYHVYSDEKLELLKVSLSKRMYLQEIEAEFLDTNLNSLFHSFSIENHLKKDIKSFNTGETIYISLDQNVDNGSGVIARYSADLLEIVDEIHIDQGANYESYSSEIIKKIPEKSVINLYGDASGNARDVSAKESFYKQLIQILKSKGYQVNSKVNTSNPSIFESVEELNRRFEQNKIIINSKCTNLIKDLEIAAWKPNIEGKFIIDKNKYDPHVADSLRYLVWGIKQAGPLKIRTFNPY